MRRMCTLRQQFSLLRLDLCWQQGDAGSILGSFITISRGFHLNDMKNFWELVLVLGAPTHVHAVSAAAIGAFIAIVLVDSASK